MMSKQKKHKGLCLECPAGFWYAGEVDAADLARDVWQKGDTSPVYSCYSLLQGPLDWVQASQK